MEKKITNNATIETAKGLTFGTELEYTNITREKAAKAIHSVVGSTIRYYGGGYDAWQVIAPDGRIWKAVSDGSLTDRNGSAEVVTPILRWDDMETLQEVVRALRKAGAKTGAAIGSFFCPGIGTAIGGLLGVLSGAATGAVAGNTVGKLIDENVFRIWRCESCGYEWRAA